jgi:hypothetical protein
MSAVMVLSVADHAPYLPAAHPDRAQHAELARALEDGRDERVDHVAVNARCETSTGESTGWMRSNVGAAKGSSPPDGEPAAGRAGHPHDAVDAQMVLVGEGLLDDRAVVAEAGARAASDDPPDQRRPRRAGRSFDVTT